MKTPGQKCPIEATGADLIRHSFADVARSFAGFKSSRDHKEYTPRGGNARPNKRPHVVAPAGVTYTKLPGYGVESTFNQQQRAYVGVSISGLYKLLKGELLVPRAAQPGRFSEHVVTDVSSQDPSRISFSGALARTTLRVFDDFGTHYPNLLPALSAMFRTGGGEGIDIALAVSEHMLSAAIQGKDPLQDIGYLVAGSSSQRFTTAHPYYDDVKTHEVWCPGEAVAKGIIRETGKAAVTLAAMPAIAEAYGTPFLDPQDEVRIGLRNTLEARIGAMYSAAQ